jgi:hypothetical protein
LLHTDHDCDFNACDTSSDATRFVGAAAGFHARPNAGSHSCAVTSPDAKSDTNSHSFANHISANTGANACFHRCSNAYSKSDANANIISLCIDARWGSDVPDTTRSDGFDYHRVNGGDGQHRDLDIFRRRDHESGGKARH